MKLGKIVYPLIERKMYEKQMTERQLAEKLGICHTTLSRKLSGETKSIALHEALKIRDLLFDDDLSIEKIFEQK